jgi:UDP-glucose 4-epimerase
VGRELGLRLAGARPRSARRTRRAAPVRLDERVRFHRIDLTEPRADASLAEILEKERVEAVLHAAFRSDPTPDLELDHELDTIGSLHVMNACAAAKVRRLVVASSTTLYGPHPDNPELSHRGALRCAAIPTRTRCATGSRWSGCSATGACAIPTSRSACCARAGRSDRRSRTAWSAIFSLPVVPLPIGYDPLLQLVHEQDLLDAFERALLTSRPGCSTSSAAACCRCRCCSGSRARARSRCPRRCSIASPTIRRRGRPAIRPPAFFDYLRYLWVADGQRGWDAFGEPVYSTKEAWISFVSSRRMRRYR